MSRRRPRHLPHCSRRRDRRAGNRGAGQDTSPPLSNWPSAAALAEITFEHCLRGLFQQIEGGLTVEQVIGRVADRARIAERVEEKLGDLPHQATVVSAWLARFAAAAAADAPH